MKAILETLICPCCNAVFTARKWSKRKYCSSQCADKINGLKRKTSETRYCLICNTSFETRLSKDQKYCSQKCMGIAQTISTNWQTHDCEWCGETFTRYNIEPIHFCCKACHGNWMTQHRKGENNPAYKTGRVLANRGSGWQTKREVVKKRDGYKCQICGRKPKQNEKRVISVHHIKPYREFKSSDEANAMSNLITLCRKCHDKVEHGKLACPIPLI